MLLSGYLVKGDSITLLKLFLIVLIFIPELSSSAEKGYPDYDGLGHRLYLSSLRAGNHDESGENEYYFILTAQAGKKTGKAAKEPKSDAPEKAEPITLDPVTFAEVTIKSLDKWKAPDPVEGALFTDIPGDSLRELTSTAMRTLGVHEQDVLLSIKVDMFEKNKKFFFFGEDQLVNSVSYRPADLLVKFKKSDPPVRQEVKIVDDQGTDVTLSLRFIEKNTDKENSESEK